MTLKHTPGPWESFGPMRFTVYGGDPKVRIAVIDYCTGADSAEHDANARLISAAPDLLAALRSNLEYLELKAQGFAAQYPPDHCINLTVSRQLEQTRAAISKATGE